MRYRERYQDAEETKDDGKWKLNYPDDAIYLPKYLPFGGISCLFSPLRGKQHI